MPIERTIRGLEMGMDEGRDWDEVHVGIVVFYGLVLLGLLTLLGLVGSGVWWVVHHIYLRLH